MTELKLKETFLPIVLINNELYGKKKWDGKSKKKSGMGKAWTGDQWRKKQKKIYVQISTTNTNITQIVALGSRSMISSGGAQMRRMKQPSPDCKVHCFSNTLFSKDVKG